MDNTYFEEAEYPFLDKLKKCITLYINISLALLATFILLRALEFLYIVYQTQPPKEIIKVVMQALIFDLVFFIKLLPAGFLIFLVMFFASRNKRAAYWAYGTFATLLIITYLLLIKYFATALVPLGSDLYAYNLSEIQDTAGTGGKLDILFIVIILLPVGAFWFFSNRLYKVSFIKPVYASGFLLSGFILLFLNVSALPQTTSFKDDFSFNVALNKQAYFFEKSYEYFFDAEPEIDIYAGNYLEDEYDDNTLENARFVYTSDEYPFLRKDQTADVLSNFFNIDSAKAPNIVFLQIEGLGRAYSGPNAYLGSFTPFLDSLAQQSLYWENFLSAQGRTFASLPSILGSMPFAKNGYLDQGNAMPKDISLLSILRKNGYDSRFYCGFNLSFDNNGMFLKRQKVNTIIEESNFGSGFAKSPKTENGFSWGYADKELFENAIQLEQRSSKQPYITYIMSTTMHTPYTMPGQQTYLDLVEKHMDKLGFDEVTKANHRRYKNIYSTILYTDSSLKQFFKAYSKFAAYSNTIFIITGDHRLPEIPISTKIDRYHVPLIIYSPLLKRTASFKSISSHLDITPSLLSILKNSYKLNTPNAVTWVGSGLDTARVFRNIHKVPLKQVKSDLFTFVSGLYFLDLNVLFNIEDNLNVIPVKDEAVLNTVKGEFNRYRNLNDKFIAERKLIPDTLYNQYK